MQWAEQCFDTYTLKWQRHRGSLDLSEGDLLTLADTVQSARGLQQIELINTKVACSDRGLQALHAALPSASIDETFTKMESETYYEVQLLTATIP